MRPIFTDISGFYGATSTLLSGSSVTAGGSASTATSTTGRGPSASIVDAPTASVVEAGWSRRHHTPNEASAPAKVVMISCTDKVKVGDNGPLTNATS